ncbi:MAG: mucin7-like protein [Candidatus Saccharibacteria bacterium]|nr:mucin7-like protein [Candidatus Saccharibacteria bacterium]
MLFFISFGSPLSAYANDGTLTVPSASDTGTTLQSSTTSDTGTATVDANTDADSATSGDAVATATDVTISDSTTGLGNPAVQGSFTQNIAGTVIGDVILTPTPIDPIQGGAVSTSTPATGSSNSSQTVTVGAVSGNATVTNNSSAGNATTGNAIAQVNSVTIANSWLVSPTTFIGTVNIFGNLTGDIFMTPNFMPQLVASSSSPSQSNLTASSSVSVNNNVTLSATSGNADVVSNGTAGNATTGNAATGLTIYEVTGQQLNAANSLFVIVNVLGEWQGTIVASNQGAMTAFLADGVTTNSTLSSASNTPPGTVIVNKLTATAQSGNATVSTNDLAGNATSGNAFASINILNLANDTLNISGWMGILFINVYGDWIGNFGFHTPATPVSTTSPDSFQTVQSAVDPPSLNAPEHLLQRTSYITVDAPIQPGIVPLHTSPVVISAAPLRTSTQSPAHSSDITFGLALGVITLLTGIVTTLYILIKRA